MQPTKAGVDASCRDCELSTSYHPNHPVVLGPSVVFLDMLFCRGFSVSHRRPAFYQTRNTQHLARSGLGFRSAPILALHWSSLDKLKGRLTSLTCMAPTDSSIRSLIGDVAECALSRIRGGRATVSVNPPLGDVHNLLRRLQTRPQSTIACTCHRRLHPFVPRGRCGGPKNESEKSWEPEAVKSGAYWRAAETVSSATATRLQRAPVKLNMHPVRAR
ncbi:hypothetical protein C8Q80DRAFT_598541 [Daedaleopsis nitida]|nr:hypothetical protein C8Q80DRAFT_598541 [Daedaleopsis nitida]